MKNIVLLFLGLIVLGCNPDDKDENVEESYETYLKYSLKLKSDPTQILYIQEYVFDNNGKVVSENYTNINNPQYNHYSTFAYDDNGRIIQEVRDGDVFFNINWTNDLAEVYNSQNVKISEFNFNGTILTYYKTGFNTNTIRTKFFNYDSNQNIISIENETEIYVEFLDYDLDKRNPLHLIESIGILRIDYKPYFKNIFGTEKVYPFEGGDYTQPLTFYDYFYEFDAENRVYQIEDEKSLIYIREFEYE
ncbi:hypothetical protein BWZ20_13295 [Winogradskyella sp. J14-2]|uniref:hypothetical protein n=1 Tax=Winogradskyella sp. J14-2 TaxID=1936080 RepID=UPI00097269BE|nr:hypothetical protein [Winogradskyella sp. J14-2]APY09218.1 hypothetical protein BWZ20_13295 [Winogradskyella sp. J14-2]